jgi:hypothetical protein
MLFDFNPRIVAQEFTIYTLFAQLQELLPEGKEPSIPVYGFCRTITTGARYLACFPSAEVFLEYVEANKGNQKPEDGIEKIVTEIDEKVSGLGHALILDFLKELGFTRFVKPDIHTIDLYHKIAQVEKIDAGYFFTISFLRQLADEVDQTPYSLDRMFWLIGSGNFYREREQDREARKRWNVKNDAEKRREDFVAWLKDRLTSTH